MGGYLERKRIGTDWQRESVSTAPNDGAPVNLDLLFIMVVLIRPISYITINSNTDVVLSTDFLDVSTVAIETIPVSVVAIPVSVVAIPVSVSYAVVDEGSVFIFAELADKLRLQG